MCVEYDIMVIYPRDISHCCFNCQRLCSDSGTMVSVKCQHENNPSVITWQVFSHGHYTQHYFVITSSRIHLALTSVIHSFTLSQGQKSRRLT